MPFSELISTESYSDASVGKRSLVMMNQGISTEDLSYRKYLPVLDSQWPLLTWGLVSQSCSCMATFPFLSLEKHHPSSAAIRALPRARLCWYGLFCSCSERVLSSTRSST
jgi:hypothetical protein